jgi:ABC-type sulfate/molybdate transport systems ATPase subunit
VRTLGSARLSLSELTREIHSRFEITISRAAISTIRHNLHFHYQPARHVLVLNPGQVEDLTRFCQEMPQRPHEFNFLTNLVSFSVLTSSGNEIDYGQQGAWRLHSSAGEISLVLRPAEAGTFSF